MKHIFPFLIALLIGQSSYALQCESIFAQEKSTSDRQFLNALKRIRNYATFKTVVLVHPKTQRMTLVVFDIFNDGVIGERKSINDHVQELREFGSEIRWVQDAVTEHHILASRFVKLPTATKNENLLESKFEEPISPAEISKKPESLEENIELEVFKSFYSWISKPGPQLNVVLIPETMQKSFIENLASLGEFRATTLDSLIETVDPINSK